MFESVVRCAGEDKVAGAELFDVAQALELRRVDDANAQRMQLYVTVDRIVEHLPTAMLNSPTTLTTCQQQR